MKTNQKIMAKGLVLAGLSGLFGVSNSYAQQDSTQAQSEMGLATLMGDFDKDGDMDLIIASKVKGKELCNIYYSENYQSKELLPPKKIGTIPMAKNSNIGLTKYDSGLDNDLDVLIGAKNPSKDVATIYRLENIKNKLQWPKKLFTVPMAKNTAISLTSYDYAKDKDIDIIITAQDPKTFQNVVYKAEFIDKQIYSPKKLFTIPNN